MLSNSQEFQVLLERYDDDPAVCSKLLRTFSLSDPETFLAYAEPAILQRPVTRVLKFIANLAVAAGVVQKLIDRFPADRKGTLAYAKKLTLCEPRFDTVVAEYLTRPGAAIGEEASIHTILDILEKVSDGDRLVPTVLKMLKHPNPKIRSKAALFVGSRTQNVAWAASHSQEYDGRVRANILESLFGLNSDVVQQIYRSHINDENNRAAGNALLGLYQLGNPEAIPHIWTMAKHPDARFRNTCAWLMGYTKDPRFLPALADLMQDPDELVRSQVFKAIAEIKRAQRASRPQYQCAILQMQHAGEGGRAIAAVYDDQNQPVRRIPGTAFILRNEGPEKSIRSFAVEEWESRSSLNVAFVLCLPEQHAADVEAAFSSTLSACLPLRRPKDRWAVIKVAPQIASPPAPEESGRPINRYRSRFAILQVDLDDPSQPSPSAEPKFEYSLQNHRIAGMLQEPAIALEADPGSPRTKIVTDILLKTDIASSDPQIVFIGAGPHTIPLSAIQQRLANSAAAIHILGYSPAWSSNELQSAAERTDGSFQIVHDLVDLKQACIAVCSSLLHHYRLSWPADEFPTSLQIEYADGRAVAEYGSVRVDALAS